MQKLKDLFFYFYGVIFSVCYALIFIFSMNDIISENSKFYIVGIFIILIELIQMGYLIIYSAVKQDIKNAVLIWFFNIFYIPFYYAKKNGKKLIVPILVLIINLTIYFSSLIYGIYIILSISKTPVHNSNVVNSYVIKNTPFKINYNGLNYYEFKKDEHYITLVDSGIRIQNRLISYIRVNNEYISNNLTITQNFSNLLNRISNTMENDETFIVNGIKENKDYIYAICTVNRMKYIYILLHYENDFSDYEYLLITVSNASTLDEKYINNVEFLKS